MGLGRSSGKGSTDGYEIPRHSHFAVWNSGTSSAVSRQQYSGKVPLAASWGLTLFPETWAVCSWERPDAGLDTPLTKHSHSFPCSAKISALHCTTFVGCILFTCIAMQYIKVCIYELLVKPSEKWTSEHTYLTVRQGKSIAQLFTKHVLQYMSYNHKTSIQNSQSMPFFL